MKETYAAILRLDHPEIHKEFFTSTTLPNEKKPTTFHWHAGNNFEVEVPTRITYVDDHKHTHVFNENYAAFLLKSYPILKFVKELKRDEFEKPAFEGVFGTDTVAEEVKPDVVSETKVQETKKETKHEKK